MLSACLPVPVSVPPRMSPHYLGPHKWESNLGCGFKHEHLVVEGPDGLRMGLTPRLVAEPAALVLDLVYSSSSRRPLRVEAARLRSTHMQQAQTRWLALTPRTLLTAWILEFEVRISPLPAGTLRVTPPPVWLGDEMWQPGEVELRPQPASVAVLPFNC